MGLLEQHKAERRARILAAARKLIARRGVDKLTMRDLAEASRVSVPTVYNLVGGKSAVLVALMDDMFMRIAQGVAMVQGDDFLDRAIAILDTGHAVLIDAPSYSRQLVHHFLANDEADQTRQQVDEANIQMMGAVLAAGQASGCLVPWADPVCVAASMYGQFMACTIRWAKGEADDESFAAGVRLGTALILRGVAMGSTIDRLTAIIVDTQEVARSSMDTEMAPQKEGVGA